MQPENTNKTSLLFKLVSSPLKQGRAEQIVLAFRTKFEERNWIKLLVIQYHPPAMIDGWKRAENWEVINKLEGYAPAEIVDGKFIFFAQGEAEMERKFLWNGDKFVNAL
ncbi:MAG: hypothetical protein IPN95_17120 [Bacteroidetes bacterium]|nr:hypothetical protein [Bacteroidota bacterium]